MPVPSADPDPSWAEALRRAADELPAGESGAHLFLEEREDLRLVLGMPGELREAVHTRLRGLSVSGGSDGTRLAYRSGPEPADALRLVRGSASGQSDRKEDTVRHGPVTESPLGSEGPEGVLGALLDEVAREAGGSLASVSGRWVAFHQAVRIARPGLEVTSDLRRGSRVRLEVGIEAGGCRSAAVAERAFRPGREEPEIAAALAAQVVGRARERLEARPVRAGEWPAVFAPGVGGILVHELVGHALEADTILRDGSLLARQDGRVAPPEIVVTDDPRRGRASWRIDDEGEPARATPLVREGRVVGWLQDQRSALRSGRRPTGHGRRSVFHEPVRPRMGCTFLAPGRHEEGEVLEGIAAGVYVRRMELASADPGSGTATFRVSDADWIHRGRIEAPLEEFLMKVSAIEALAGLDRVAGDLTFDVCIGSCLRDGQPLATSVGAPTFRTGMVRVAP